MFTVSLLTVLAPFNWKSHHKPSPRCSTNGQKNGEEKENMRSGSNSPAFAALMVCLFHKGHFKGPKSKKQPADKPAAAGGGLTQGHVISSVLLCVVAGAALPFVLRHYKIDISLTARDSGVD